MSENKSQYIGRYAPSPTGRLHLGNLRTALLAWLHARLNKGQWLLRFDDLDTPRLVVNSDEQIKSDLTALGLYWDGEPYYQSQHINDYQMALDALDKRNLIYNCYCSRKDIQQALSAPHGKTAVYPGTCQYLSKVEQAQKAEKKTPAMRLRVGQAEVDFVDGVLGRQQQLLARECGDFVIRRADGLFAYQLAIVIDDIQHGVTDVVRGADLLDSTARQLYLFELLQDHKRLPTFWHMPLLTDDVGKRLAKRDGSDSLGEWLDSGKTSEQLIAQFAHELDLLTAPEPAISAAELLDSLTLEQFQRCLVACRSC